MPREQLYAQIDMQRLPFNTPCQTVSMRHNNPQPAVEHCADALIIYGEPRLDWVAKRDAERIGMLAGSLSRHFDRHPIFVLRPRERLN